MNDLQDRKSDPFGQDEDANPVQRHRGFLFRAAALAFAAVMLAVCVLLGWCAVDGYRQEETIVAIKRQNDFDRGRVNLQRSEYNQVMALLPGLQERVEELEAARQAGSDEIDVLLERRALLTAEANQSNVTRASRAYETQAKDAETALADAMAEYQATLQRLGLISGR